jgi:uncharacterized protein (DUF302 family)
MPLPRELGEKGEKMKNTNVLGLALAGTLLAGAALGAGALAGSVQFVKDSSSHSFRGTIAALKQAIAANGLMVLGQLNQAAVLSQTGLQLQGAQAFFVGNPVVGKALFSMDPAVGLLIPARIYVWEAHNTTYVGFLNPAQLWADSMLKTSMNAKLAEMLGMIDAKLTAIAAQATK